MEPTNKPHLSDAPLDKGVVLEFLPDADEIERSPLPPYLRITVQTMLAALVVAIVWASLSSIDLVVTAHGRLVNPLPNIVVQPLESAIVQAIHVRVGQVVKKGEVLATLDPTFTRADEAQLRSRLQSLDTQSGDLRSELAGNTGRVAAKAGSAGTDGDSALQAQLAGERRANYGAQLDKLTKTVARLRAGIDTNRRDQQLLAPRLKSLTEVEQMYDKLLAENYGARLHVLEARDKRLEVERELALTVSKEQELKNELASAEAEKSAFDKSWRQKAMEDLLAASRDRAAVTEQLSKADKRSQLVSLVAPADGVVLNIAKLSPGSIVKEAEIFFTLVPLGGALEAEVQIDASDVGHIKPGDDVQVKLDAFPFQKHGALKSKVRVISEDAFRREAGAPSTAPDAYYISNIDLGMSKLRNMTSRERLLPGMTLSAEIVVGKRTVMSYLLWPLTKALSESIREP
jgi:hemolysin D